MPALRLDMHALAATHTSGAAPQGAGRPAPPQQQLRNGAPAPPQHRRRRHLTIAAARQEEGAPRSTAAASGGSGGDGFFEAGREGEERQRLFNTIAPVYDQLNDQLSLGLHRVWKRMAVKWSGARTGGRALDVCCGSGDLAFRLAEAVGPSGSVVGLDFSANMLADAARRQQERQAALGPAYRMDWVQVQRGVLDVASLACTALPLAVTAAWC